MYKRSYGIGADKRIVGLVGRWNQADLDLEIGEMEMMNEQTGEQLHNKKQASGVWVLLVFVVLLAAVLVAAMATM